MGREICKAFIAVGADVVGVNRNPEESGSIVGVDYYSLDITDRDAVRDMFAKLFASYGQFDILVNNAGVGCFGEYCDRTSEEIDLVTDVNIKGTIFCTDAFVTCCGTRETKASILNIASYFGNYSPDFRNYVDYHKRCSEIYSATKAGVIQLTKYYAVHLAGQGYRVNCVSPGGILNTRSPQGIEFQKRYSSDCPLGRMAYVEEVPGAILFLASDASSYITGQNLLIDGGMSAW